MNFLYPYAFLVFFIAVIILLFNKKRYFTHLELFKKNSKFTLPILDLVILFSFSVLLMYPIQTQTTTLIQKTHYKFDNSKQKLIILIMDVSLSMNEEEDYFDEAKNEAKSIIDSNEKAKFIIVAFEKDYMIVDSFVNYKKALYDVDNLELNMVTHIGGSMLRDTVAGVINSFNYLHPKIYIFSDGSDNDESAISIDELKNLAKNVNIEYIGYGDNKNNQVYASIFKHKYIKNQNFETTLKKAITYSYEVLDNRFVFIVFLLLLYKIIRIRFENYFNN